MSRIDCQRVVDRPRSHATVAYRLARYPHQPSGEGCHCAEEQQHIDPVALARQAIP